MNKILRTIIVWSVLGCMFAGMPTTAKAQKVVFPFLKVRIFYK